MNIRVYLGQEIKNSEGFSASPVSSGGQEWVESKFRGDRIGYANGFFYIDLSHFDEPVSDEIRQFIKKVSLRDRFRTDPKRTIGSYGHKSARAKLDLTRWDMEIVYELNVVGNTLGDVSELYCRIRAGTILSVESWEKEQTRARSLWKRLSSLLPKRTSG